MNIHFNTPEGTRDRLYAECLERRQVQGALVDLFRRRGYAEVITPEVEKNVVLSARNIPGVITTTAKVLSVYDIVNANRLVVDKAALAIIEEVFA